MHLTTMFVKVKVTEVIEVLLGNHLPEGAVHKMTDRMRRSIWVLGILHLLADRVRKFSTMNKGYIFHTELNDEDTRTILFGSRPEVVRIENGLKWHQMRYVATEVHRVVTCGRCSNLPSVRCGAK